MPRKQKPPPERETRVFQPRDRVREPIGDVQTAVSPEAIDEVLAQHPPAFDADREPDFSGPAGPARFSKQEPAPVPELRAILPIGKRGDGGFVWELSPLWTERLDRLAKAAGMNRDGFLESLLRRAWVSLPPKLRRDDDPPHGGSGGGEAA